MSMEPLTAEEVATLDAGTPILVIWSGGNGPHRYRVHVDRWGRRYAAPLDGRPSMLTYNPLEFVGRERYHTRVWLTTRNCHHGGGRSRVRPDSRVAVVNRAQRRDLKRQVKKMAGKVARRTPGKDFVTLKGGPMDGWIVKPDAPALEPDWREEYIRGKAKAAFEQTREFGLLSGAPVAELPPPWADLTDAKRAEYVNRVRAQVGGGRYVAAGAGVAKWEPA